MSLTGPSLNRILERHNEIEKQAKQLQQQVEAFATHFNITSDLSSLPQQPAKSQQSSVQSTTSGIPSGNYAVFVSTQNKSVPIEVITAFLVAQESCSSDIKLKIIDNEKYPISKINTPAPTKAEIFGNVNVTRLLFRISGRESNNNVIETSLIDEWMNKSIDFANKLENKEEFNSFINDLNEYLQLRSFLVGYNINACDITLYSILRRSELWTKISSSISPPHKGPINVLRWFTMINESDMIKNTNQFIMKSQEQIKKKQAAQAKKQQKKKNKNNAGGKGKKSSKQKPVSSASWNIGIGKEYDGKIVTRFPPEPSGFLHIGHAKAVFINWFISRQFNGKMIMRLDDTNPTKEKAEFVDSIKRDLSTLGVTPEISTNTSDYFDYYIKCCTRVIKSGHAYVDPTPTKQMRQERMDRMENKYRTQSIDENLRLWKEMQNGSDEGLKCCVRMRLDMQSNNGTLRDPTMYRCNIKDSHHQHGMKYKVYPTYDFACPIVDSIEGVTHAFRSKEYNERNVQYKEIWDIVCKGQKNPLDEKQELRLPNMFQFSRQEFTRTVLSKRKLAKLIERGIVGGWDDPRLPTIQGIFRRGLQIEALKQFIMDQAMSTSNTEQEWDKIWTYNKRVLDPKVGRYFFVSSDYAIINITNLSSMDSLSTICVPLHPKKKQVNDLKKIMSISNKIYVEKYSLNESVKKLKEKNQTHLILQNWGIINVDKINYDENNKDLVISIDATFEKNNKNWSGKPSPLSWIADNGLNNLIPVTLVELDYIFSYKIQPKQDDEKKMETVLVENENNTWFETNGFAESSLRLLSKGDIIQFIKRGFYIVDKPYLGRPSEPAVLIYIPDGKTKKMSDISSKKSKVSSNIGSKENKKNNKK